jgi:ATP-dependent exoDNAse (exonuclease V) beta subunit
LIVKDVPRHVVADGRSEYDRWRLARLDAIASGGQPSLRVDTVRQWSGVAGNALPAGAAPHQVQIVTIPAAAAASGRRSGAGLGALVHAVLAAAPFDAGRSDLESLAEVEARLAGLDQHDARAAAATAERVLRHDLLRRAASADARGACRRETPVTLTLEDGTILEGIVDLAFEDEGVWTVIDYKTDRELETGEDAYRRQIAIYAAAIERATGAPARGMLVRV